MNPRDRARLDQDTAKIAEVLSALWMGIFRSLVDRGFSERQAMSLLRTYIKTTLPRTQIEGSDADGQ